MHWNRILQTKNKWEYWGLFQQRKLHLYKKIVYLCLITEQLATQKENNFDWRIGNKRKRVEKRSLETVKLGHESLFPLGG